MSVRALIDRWYTELWNPWAQDVLPEIAHEDVTMLGSLGVERSGHAGIWSYMGFVQAAFPDFHNEVLAVMTEGDVGLAHLRYTGTHQGHLQGIEPTGKRVSYEGLARFSARDGKLSQVWVLGDQLGLRAQLQAGDQLPHARESKQRVVPTLRSTDWDRSRAFWVGGLGFAVDFEWRHAPGFPVYVGLSRDGATFHLSEHAGDCQVGGSVAIWVDDVDALHAELSGRRGLDVPEPVTQPWGRRELALADPDGNKVIFHTPTQ